MSENLVKQKFPSPRWSRNGKRRDNGVFFHDGKAILSGPSDYWTSVINAGAGKTTVESWEDSWPFTAGWCDCITWWLIVRETGWL